VAGWLLGQGRLKVKPVFRPDEDCQRWSNTMEAKRAEVINSSFLPLAFSLIGLQKTKATRFQVAILFRLMCILNISVNKTPVFV
jgi:hypothetical protein